MLLIPLRALFTDPTTVKTIAFHSLTNPVQGSSSQKVALFASLGFGRAVFVFAIPGRYTIDRQGRSVLDLFCERSLSIVHTSRPVVEFGGNHIVLSL